MSQREGHNQDSLSIASLLRMAADGELDAQQKDILRAHLDAHPEDEARIGFERDLRGACCRACSPDCCAPAGLRDRVVRCCCETDLADGLASRAGQTRHQSFWAGRLVVRFGAVAALLALVAVMAVMVSRSAGPTPTSPGAILETQAVAERIAAFTRDEHDRCAGMPMQGDTKFTIREVDEVPDLFTSLTGQTVTMDRVFAAAEHGLRFVDAGECHLPMTGVAVHLRFETDDPDAGLISLWIQPDDESLEMEDGVTYACGEGCSSVRFWRADGMRYVLVAPDLGLAESAGKALHCPEASRPFNK